MLTQNLNITPPPTPSPQAGRGSTPAYPVSFSRRGRLRTRTGIADSMLLLYFFSTSSLLLLLLFFSTSSLLHHYSFTTPSLLLHYSFTTLSLLLHYSFATTRPSLILRSTFARPSLILRSSSDRTSLRADGDAWWWRRGCLRTRLCQRGIHKKSVNSLDVVPATEALALPFTIETTTRSPRRYNKRG